MKTADKSGGERCTMKLSYETHFRSNRPDGRFTSTMAAYMASLRQTPPSLELPKDADESSFAAWRSEVREKAKELLCMPPFPPMSEPTRLSAVRRDGYTVEKWEFYPDAYSAVPVLLLIPDTASEARPAPAVLCFPGSTHSKEFIAGEPLLDRPACGFVRYPERNRMAQYLVKNGMVAVAFDNPAIGECAFDIEDKNDYGAAQRTQLCYGYLQSGFNYPGIAVFQALRFMELLPRFPFIDQNRLGVCAHSLGTTTALFTALLDERIRAVVFNDYICSWRENYVAVTEEDEHRMTQNCGNWHQIPGLFRYFDRPDLLAALAPRYLTMNEGGAECHVDKVMRAYRLAGAEGRVFLSQYPKYKDEKLRVHHGDMPLYGMTEEEMMDFNYVDAPDHSFRQEPSLALLKKAFGMEGMKE